jgi:predicted ATPase
MSDAHSRLAYILSVLASKAAEPAPVKGSHQMNDEFRLRSASFPGRDGVDVEVALTDGHPAYGTGVTAVTGRNGAGKSRLLANVAMAFDALDVGKPRAGARSEIEYTIGNSLCVISSNDGKLSTSLNGAWIEPQRLPRPRAVAAVTTSAFDRFELPRARNDKSPSILSQPTYNYLGLKDDRGRVSATAGVYRALDKAFEAVTRDIAGRARIADVFAYLGYVPRVEIAYRWTARGTNFRDRGEESGVEGYATFLSIDARSDGAWSRHSERSLESDGAFEALAKAVVVLDERSAKEQVSLVADSEHFRAAQLLKREGMLATKHVLLTVESTGAELPLGKASSGELSLVTATLGIATTIDSQCLILIDEPEISLHPEWQSSYFARLQEAFESFAGCHFVVATHSPLLVAGLTKKTQNRVLSLEHDRQVDRELEYVEGRSSDEAMVSAFGVAGPENLFIKQTLVRALRMTADRKYDTAEFVSLMSMLRQAARSVGVSSAIRDVVSDLERTVARARDKTR